MAQASFAVLLKNTGNAVSGFSNFFAGVPAALATWKKIKDRQWEAAPQPVKDQAECWDETYWKRHLCQHKNMWVDPELSNAGCSQKELAQFCEFKMDMWRMMHWGMLVPLTGVYSLAAFPIWFGNNTWVPSTFNTTAEQKLQYRKDLDLYRYKHVPALLAIERWFFEFHIQIGEEGGRKYDQLYDNNTVRKDPVDMRYVADNVEYVQPFFRIRRKQVRAIARAMGIPTFPQFGKICLQSRVRDYMEIIWNEDMMVIKDQLHKNFSDEELQDYAWRRFMAPYDKELTREQLLERVEDYFTFLGPKFVEESKTPNIFITINYMMSYYKDPAYLEGDISELDQDDFTHLKSWGKDAFLKRLEFENGPLRDQVEAHSVKALAEREAKLAELAK